MVLLSGKVVEITTKSQQTVAVSLWIRQIEGENGCCLAVAEPVERRVAQIVINSHGTVMSGDYEATLLFQFDSPDQLNELGITQLIPAIQRPATPTTGNRPVTIPKHIYKQKATGRTQEAVAFPLCLMIKQNNSANESSNASSTDSGIKSGSVSFTVTMWVFTNISGLLVIDENCTIESCNHHFSMFMFGYPQSKMIRREVFHVIPNFGKDTRDFDENTNAKSSY
jgi:PAS domain containing serine/threonine kinase